MPDVLAARSATTRRSDAQGYLQPGAPNCSCANPAERTRSAGFALWGKRSWLPGCSTASVDLAMTDSPWPLPLRHWPQPLVQPSAPGQDQPAGTVKQRGERLGQLEAFHPAVRVDVQGYEQALVEHPSDCWPHVWCQVLPGTGAGDHQGFAQRRFKINGRSRRRLDRSLRIGQMTPIFGTKMLFLDQRLPFNKPRSGD